MRKGWQKRHHFDRAARSQLAGKAHIGYRADTAQHTQFVLARRIDAVKFTAHSHAASRTATPPATDMGMRDAGEPAGLEHGRAGRNLNKAAVRITDAHEAAASLPSPADEAAKQHRHYSAEEDPGE